MPISSSQLGRFSFGKVELGSDYSGQINSAATLLLDIELVGLAFTPPLVGAIDGTSVSLEANSNGVGIFKGDSLLGRAFLGVFELGASRNSILIPESPLNISLNLTADHPSQLLLASLEI